MTTPPIKRSAELDADLKTRAISLLLEETTTTQETNAVIRVGLRARFLWRCRPCRADYHLTTGQCSCGTPRPDGLA